MIPVNPGFNRLSDATYNGVFDVLWTLGFGTVLPQTWGFLRTGLIVTIYPITQITGTSTSVFFSTGTANNIPEELRPARLAQFSVPAVDNAVNVRGMILFNASNGAIALGASDLSTLINNWTAAGTKSFPVANTPYFTYVGVAA